MVILRRTGFSGQVPSLTSEVGYRPGSWLPPTSKRRTHSPEFKAEVAQEAISGRKTNQEIATDQAIHPIQVSQWKPQLLDGASRLFTRGSKSKEKEDCSGQGG